MKISSRGVLAGFLLLAVACPVLGQEKSPRRQAGERPPRAGSDEATPRGERRPDRAGAGEPRQSDGAGNLRTAYEQFARRLPEQLELDAAQRRAYDHLAADFLESLRDTDTQRGERARLQREYRRALQDGEQEKAAQLRAELRSLGDVRTLAREFLDDVEQLLRPEQAERFAELRRENRTRGRAGPEDTGDYRAMLETLPAELKLDPRQQARYRPIEQEFRAALDREEAGWQKLRQLQAEIRDAAAAGDQARLESLRNQAEAARPDTAASAEKFFDQLEPLLRDDQQGLLAELRARHGDHNAAPPVQRSLQDLQRAVRRLRLGEEQRQPVRDALAAAQRAMRRADPDDGAARAKILADAQAQVRAQLNPEQREQLERELAQTTEREGARRTNVERNRAVRRAPAEPGNREESAPDPDRRRRRPE